MKKIFALLSVIFAMLSFFIPYDQMGYVATLLQRNNEISYIEAFVMGVILPQLPIIFASLFTLMVLSSNENVPKKLVVKIVPIGLLLIMLPIFIIEIFYGASFGAPIYKIVYFGIYVIVSVIAFVMYQIKSTSITDKNFTKV